MVDEPGVETSVSQKKRMGFFERYLTLWVGLCMVGGVLLGRIAPSVTGWLRGVGL